MQNCQIDQDAFPRQQRFDSLLGPFPLVDLTVVRQDGLRLCHLFPVHPTAHPVVMPVVMKAQALFPLAAIRLDGARSQLPHPTDAFGLVR